MKTILYSSILILILSFFYNTFYAQAPTCKWANSAYGDYHDRATSVIADNSGNVIIAGHFYSSELIFDTITLVNNGSNNDDIFLVKYNSDGDLLWAKNFGNTSMDKANAIAIDSIGNIYITGSFIGATIAFDSITISSNGWDEVYIVKLNSSGDVIWAKSAGGSRNDIGKSITTDNSGNVYVTGVFGSTVMYFESDSLLNFTGYPGPPYDIFFSKYDSNGNLVWIKRIGGIYGDEIFSISSDNNGNIYLAGSFYSSVLYFESDSLEKQYGKSDFYIIKYNSLGYVDWANSGGGDSTDVATSVIADNMGNVYLGGYYKSPNFYYNNNVLINASSYTTDIFAIKYSQGGDPVWGNSIGMYDNEYLNSLSIGPSENLILSGNFASSSIVFGPNTLTNKGSSDILLACYNDDGSPAWSKSIGNVEAESCNSVFYDQLDNLYIAGYYRSPTLAFDSIVLTNSYYMDLFVAKLNDLPIGIETYEKPLLISMYPNPSSSHLSIKLPLNSELEILNLNGKVIRKLVADRKTITIDISGLSKGLYILNITSDNKTVTKKIIKQ